ncbi:MAG: carboxylesterase/lipase family protein [Actinomycetota bacterium]|nr:carboxylesterase/lipase family protein [Actinomycetota bacterium]
MTIAATRSGKIEGIERDGVLVFKGIPYAAPPVGARRWLAPEREDAWDGVRDATQFSAQSAQGAFGMNMMMGGTEPVTSEDSLYLNVYTPACDDARRPVMLWIHGGAFIFGSGDTPWYDGSQFCRHGDVVVVTINYRLGAFGYLHLADLFGEEFEGSGNAAVLDQMAALDWVRDSIIGFGGDPDQVTVFGESAGAGSVGTLLGTPRAAGLFHRAIAQSGGSSWWSSRERATEIAQIVIDELGVKAGDVDALRAITTRQLIDIVPTIGGMQVGSLNFQPVVDGTVLPKPPTETIAAGNHAGVPVLAGTNRHEMTLFNLVDPTLTTVDDAGIAERLSLIAPNAEAIVANYRSRRLDVPALDVFTDVASDAVFRMPVQWMLDAQSAHAPVWCYLFTWESPVFGGILKSTHALEITFAFDNLTAPGVEMMTGPGPERQAIADAMHRAWIAFARTGDPNHTGLPTWPAYDQDQRPTMRFDTTVELLSDPLGEDRRAWGTHRV